MPQEKKVGLGYYPTSQGEKIAQRRAVEGKEMRARIFSQASITDRGQKLLVYAGGNNDEYFSKAFPAFLRFINQISEQKDLSDYVIVLQQHPGAKDRNLDGKFLEEWTNNQKGQASLAPLAWRSEMNSDDAQVAADAMLYYQTSMGPQFVLAGIPTIQVGPITYEDILVRNELCSTATDADQLGAALTRLQRGSVNVEAIREGLGLHSDWDLRLEKALLSE